MNLDPFDHALTLSQAKGVVLKAFGWVIRHLMVLRDNYFGSFTQFCTLFEYIQKKDRGLPIGDPTEFKYRPGKVLLCSLPLSTYFDRPLAVQPLRSGSRIQHRPQPTRPSCETPRV